MDKDDYINKIIAKFEQDGFKLQKENIREYIEMVEKEEFKDLN